MMISSRIQQADGWQMLFDIMQPWFKGRAILVTTWLLQEEWRVLPWTLHRDWDILRFAKHVSESHLQFKRKPDPGSGQRLQNAAIDGRKLSDILTTRPTQAAAAAPCLCRLKAPTGAKSLQSPYAPAKTLDWEGGIRHWSNVTSLGFPALRMLNTNSIRRSTH